MNQLVLFHSIMGIFIVVQSSFAQIYPFPEYPKSPNSKEQSSQPLYGTPFVESTWLSWEVKGIHFQEGMDQARVIKIMGEDYERYDVMDIHYRRGRIMSGYIGVYLKNKLESAHVLKWTYQDSSHYVYEAYFLFLDKNKSLVKIFLRKKPLTIIAQ
ncbi:hypothetical protein IT6_03100 [Methylacidiphilum caldifontis]|uniref:hypothetical protein n=1 Tax=Methylacidiphilum caldifontis TaxID=2795386 RepID=UPI001A8F742D|nr:hypothetical protein [Methylacidiphilum caldifontis]QSR89285.1 hypothetical protein IT6_03100 [Methylacidiphilum caldifontis]